MEAADQTAIFIDLDPIDQFQEIYNRPADVLYEVAHIKRFLERYSGDDMFREAVLTGALPLTTAGEVCGCRLDVTSLRPVFDPAYCHNRAGATLDTWRLTAIWDEHLRRSSIARGALLVNGGSGGLNPRFDAWRARNVNRAALQLGVASSGITHPPVSFELSSGCSVGCWFCGISAKEFRGHATLRDGGDRIWRETLEAVQSIIGPGLRCGFCYWATDPLDNPEYTGFLEIFEEVAGSLPQTTTAIPLRNTALTREVLAMGRARRSFPNRFSVITKRALLQIHEEFTPEELLRVELVIQIMSEGGVPKFRAGRTFTEEKSKKISEKGKSLDGTIACVSGFLINIHEMTVRLISPVMPSSENPNGYITFDERIYEDPAHLKAVMNQMVDIHMPESLSGDRPISITEGGALEADQPTIRFRDFSVHNEQLTALGKLLESGDLDPLTIVRKTSGAGENPLKTIAAIETLWREGVIHQDTRVPA